MVALSITLELYCLSSGRGITYCIATLVKSEDMDLKLLKGFPNLRRFKISL